MPAETFNSICSVFDDDFSTTQSISAPYNKRWEPIVDWNTPVNCFDGFKTSDGDSSENHNRKKERNVYVLFLLLVTYSSNLCP